jgi:hypothetical protein
MKKQKKKDYRPTKNNLERVMKALRNIAGFRVSRCDSRYGDLGEVFDFVGIPIYPSERGILVKVVTRKLPVESLKCILDLETDLRKEIWYLKKKRNHKNDPGRLIVFRIWNGKIIDCPQDYPVEKILSSPRKSGTSSAKK